MTYSLAIALGASVWTASLLAALAYVLVREGAEPRWIIGAAVAFSLLVGVSRVYLDVHWATDVLGGWAVGLAVAAACIALSEWVASRAATGHGVTGTGNPQ